MAVSSDCSLYMISFPNEKKKNLNIKRHNGVFTETEALPDHSQVVILVCHMLITADLHMTVRFPDKHR